MIITIEKAIDQTTVLVYTNFTSAMVIYMFFLSADKVSLLFDVFLSLSF